MYNYNKLKLAVCSSTESNAKKEVYNEFTTALLQTFYVKNKKKIKGVERLEQWNKKNIDRKAVTLIAKY